MTYSELKAAIAEVIKTNYNQEITAVVLQDLLDSMVGMTRAQDERVLGRPGTTRMNGRWLSAKILRRPTLQRWPVPGSIQMGAKEPSEQILPQPMQKRCSPRKIMQTPTR